MFTHSVNGVECAGGSTGRMASSFFFLIQKEPARVPGSETFSLFFNADIRTPSGDVLKKCALITLHVIAKKEESLGDEWKMGCQRAQCGRAKAKLGQKTKVCPLVALVKAMCATMRCPSSRCMGLG